MSNLRPQPAPGTPTRPGGSGTCPRLDRDPEALLVHDVLPSSLTDVADHVTKARSDAERAGTRAQQETKQAVHQLAALGLSRRDAAEILGLSHPARPPAPGGRRIGDVLSLAGPRGTARITVSVSNSQPSPAPLNGARLGDLALVGTHVRRGKRDMGHTVTAG